jgi:hypothetical protein
MTTKHTIEMFALLQHLGISTDDALALRRISMTLHSWFEQECGDGNQYGSWAIERDDGTDKPFRVHHHYAHGRGEDTVSRTAIPDREAGARKRLAAIMTKYPDLLAYVQTDPRGASLYVLRKSDLPEGGELDQYYNRGVAVFK